MGEEGLDIFEKKIGSTGPREGESREGFVELVILE